MESITKIEMRFASFKWPLHLRVISFVYVLGLVFLTLRPQLPSLYSLAWGSDAGAWNMYRWVVACDVEIKLLKENKLVARIPPEDYFWHNKLASTAHAHLTKQVVDEFARHVENSLHLRPRENSLNADCLVVIVKLKKGQIDSVFKSVVELNVQTAK